MCCIPFTCIKSFYAIILKIILKYNYAKIVTCYAFNIFSTPKLHAFGISKQFLTACNAGYDKNYRYSVRSTLYDSLLHILAKYAS